MRSWAPVRPCMDDVRRTCTWSRSGSGRRRNFTPHGRSKSRPGPISCAAASPPIWGGSRKADRVKNIAREFFDVDSYFRREPEFLLRQERAEVKQAASILEAIAPGRSSQSVIAQAVGLSPSALSPHSEESGVARLPRAAISAYRQSAASHLGRVQARRSAAAILVPVRRVERQCSASLPIRPDLSAARGSAVDSFCGEGFERLCREALPLVYDSESISGRFEIGEYWAQAYRSMSSACALTAGSIRANAAGRIAAASQE